MRGHQTFGLYSFRRAARLIVLDSARRLLLVQYEGPSGLFWATPGGGLEDGEDFETAARREAREELGALSVQLTPLWENEIRYEAHGRHIRQLERFFLATSDVTPISLVSQRLEHEREGIRGIRWWALDDLRHAPVRVFPEDILKARPFRLRCTRGMACFGSAMACRLYAAHHVAPR